MAFRVLGFRVLGVLGFQGFRVVVFFGFRGWGLRASLYSSTKRPEDIQL